MIDVLQAMISQLSTDTEKRITETDIIKLGGQPNNWSFYNAVSLEIARHFHRGELSYSICDRLMSDLWAVVLTQLTLSESGEPVQSVPELFYDIYGAFDAGQFHLRPDKSDNPVEDFTKPMISKLVSVYSS